MKTLKLPITNGTFLASDVTVSGTNTSDTHNIYVAFTQADSGYLAIQYKKTGVNGWVPLGRVELTDTEVAEFSATGEITDWRFVVADASGTGSIEVTDSEKLEDIHPLSFYGETGGMSPDEIGDAIKTFRSFNNTGAWTTATAYDVNDLWSDSGTWYIVLEAYTSGASAAADIAGGTVAEYDISKTVRSATSIAEMQALVGLVIGQSVNLNDGGRSGIFDLVAGDFTAEVASDTLNGVYVALSDDPTGATKCLVRSGVTGVNVSYFGVTGENDLASMQSAGAVSKALGVPLIFDVPMIDLTGRTSISDMVEVGPGIFASQPCEITYDGFGIPVFASLSSVFKVSGSRITHICADNTDPTTSSPTSIAAIETELGISFGYSTNNNTLTKTVYAAIGCDNFVADNLSFKGQSATGNDQFNLFWIGPLTDGTTLVSNVTLTNIYARDYVFGLNSSNFKNLHIDDILLGDYYSYPANPGHFLYVSSDNDVIQQTENVYIGNMLDVGRTKIDSTPVGETTVKVLRAKNLNILNLVSYRQGGALEIGDIGGGVMNFTSYRADSTISKRSRYAFRDITLNEYDHKDYTVNGRIYASGQIDDSFFEANAAGTTVPRTNAVYNMTLVNWDSNKNNEPVVAYCENCKFNITFENEIFVSGDTILTLNSSPNNKIALTYRSPEQMRVATNAASTANEVTVNNSGRSIVKRELNFPEIISKLPKSSNVFQQRLSSGTTTEQMTANVDNEAMYRVVVDIQDSSGNRRNVVVFRAYSTGTALAGMVESNDSIGSGTAIIDAISLSFTGKTFTMNITKEGTTTDAISVTATFEVIGLFGEPS